MTTARRWLILSIVLLLAGGGGLLYAGWVRQLTSEPPSPNLVVDTTKREVRYEKDGVYHSAPLLGSPFYYPRDQYRALIPVAGPFQVSGFTVESTLTKAGTLLEVQRSDLVKFSAHTIVALLWLISLSTTAVLLKVVVGGRRAEMDMLTWTALTIFALPAIRQTMAGAPAIGIYIDFYGFLCCEVTVVLSLVGLTVAWLLRKD